MKKIPLTQNKFAIVDDSDYEYLNQWKWLAHFDGKQWYAERFMGDHVQLKMHRVILNAPSGVMVDHINRDGLDNRRSNLRLCNQSQNQMNRGLQRNSSTGYKGVSKTKYNTYTSEVGFGGKGIHLGSFKTPEDAARAYDRKAKELYGDFAFLNFPEVEK